MTTQQVPGGKAFLDAKLYQHNTLATDGPVAGKSLQETWQDRLKQPPWWQQILDVHI